MEESVGNNKQTILIVDDMAANIKILGNLLQDNYRIIATSDSRQVMSIMLSENMPDLVLLDIVMPYIDGYKICKEIKSNPVTSEIPIVFITSKIEEIDEVHAFEIGAADYITKPFHPDIVKARINVHLELKKLRDVLSKSAYLDGLTGIYNRRKLDEYIVDMLNLCQRNDLTIGTIMVDIDYFKRYNDTYGHLAGDQCLIKIANIIEHSVRRKSDLVARFGGEEFVCIMIGITKEAFELMMHELKLKVEELNIEHKSSDVSKIVTISSGGIIIKPDYNTTVYDLIESADKALYQAKENGRNQHVLIDSLKK